MKTFVDINNTSKGQFGLQFLAKNDWDALYILMTHFGNTGALEINQPMLEQYYPEIGTYNSVDNLIMN